MSSQTALILVDIQNDFMPQGALPVPDGDAIIPTVNALQKHFSLIIATQDHHPANHGSFAANHEGKNPGEIIDLHGLSQILWPVHCVQGTPGNDFVAELDMSRVTKIFPKGTDPEVDSYSGFHDNGKRKSTGLADYLREQNVDTVYIVGVATDYCVKFTALDARDEGFTTFLIEDACRGVNLSPGDSEQAIEAMRQAGVTILDSEQALARIS